MVSGGVCSKVKVGDNVAGWERWIAGWGMLAGTAGAEVYTSYNRWLLGVCVSNCRLHWYMQSCVDRMGIQWFRYIADMF